MEKRRPNPDVVALTKEACFLRGTDPRGAILRLNKARKIDPNDPFVFGVKSRCYLSLSDFKRAEKNARIGFSLDKGFVSLELLTQVLLARRKNAEAEKLVREAISLDRSFFGLGLLALVLLAERKFDEAEKLALEMVGLKRNKTSLGLLTKVFLLQGKHEKVKELNKSLLSSDDSADALITSAKICIAQKKFKEAERLVRKSLSKEESLKGIGLLGEILRKQKKYKDSLSVLECLEKEERNYQDFLCRAFCFMELGEFSEAQAQFKEAEKSLLKEPASCFDSRIRLSAGLIFLYQKMLAVNKDIEDAFSRQVKEASHWLKKQLEKNNAGEYQKRDLNGALEVAEKLNLL